MPDKIIINTENETSALIPDKWIIGTGLSTDSLYITHADNPLMIFQYPTRDKEYEEDKPCTIYAKGEIKPELLNQLFNEAWSLIEIYKSRFKDLGIRPKDFLKTVE